MNPYLLIQTRSPFESAEAERDYELAASFAAAGEEVTVFLVEEGVLPARPGARCEPFTRLAASGVRLLADDFSLRERGIAAEHLAGRVQAASIDAVVDRLAAGCRSLWL